MGAGTYLPEVAQQYERYPYPGRSPADERERLIVSYTHWLPLITHYGFGGRRDLRSGGRVLVAGSGTGDAEIFLAEQLVDSPVEIWAIDLSGTSIGIARARAEVRGLDNIRWIRGSLLDLPEMALGAFDYIACTGVLHHLEDPAAGLAALRQVLAPGGAMGIMLYGRFGRTGVYQMRDLMALIDDDETDSDVRVQHTRAVLAHLPQSNWFARSLDLIGDQSAFGDAGIFDLFLHSHDRPYSVPEVYDLVESGGLHLVSFLHQKALYDPTIMVADREVAVSVGSRSTREQQAVAELLTGSLYRHFFYCAETTRRPAGTEDGALVPYLVTDRPPEAIAAGLAGGAAGDPPTVRVENPSGRAFTIRRRSAVTVSLFAHLDGHRSVTELVRAVVADPALDTTTDEVLAELHHWERLLGIGDHLLLRHRDIPPFEMPSEVEARANQRMAGASPERAAP